MVKMYRGYRIWANPSGKTFYVSGPKASVRRYFRSVIAAIEYIDFVIKFYVSK